MNAYLQENRLLNNTAQVVGESVTAQPISKTYGLSAADSLEHLIAITFADVTVGTAISVILQDSPNGVDWSTFKSASVAGDGTVELEINILNTTDTLPWPIVRVVLTTGSGDEATVTSLIATQRI